MAHYRFQTLELDPYCEDVTAMTTADALRKYANDIDIKILDAHCVHAEDEKVIHHYEFEDSQGNVYNRIIIETEDAEALKGKKRR